MSELRRLAALVAERAGLRLHPSQVRSLTDAARRIGGGHDAERVLRAAAERDARPLLEHLLDEVTIKETFFLRERSQLESIDWHALVAGARRRGADTARVWSAGCATGEEPYTLAMLACAALGTDRPPVSVLGTDISATALRRAEAGVYARRAVKELDDAWLERWFDRTERGWQVAERVRRLVAFGRHNLVRDAEPPAAGFDLVVCRNVLIHLDPAATRHAMLLLERALTPRGSLVLGVADRLCVPLAGAERVAARPRPRSRAAERARRARRAERPLAKPPVAPGAAPQGGFEAALRLADDGRLQEALEAVAPLLERDPMHAPAQFLRGTAELARGEPRAAVAALRAALYADPGFALAAFQLGRAHEALGAPRAARPAYERALRSLAAGPAPDRWAIERVAAEDVAAACAARLASLGA